MKQLQRITLILVSLSLPIFFLLTAVRALFTPLYPMLEYRVPGFPDDIYGFTNAERLDYALIAINYITDPDVALTALSSLQFPDGSALYIDRELSHMVDVKVVYQKAMTAHWMLLGIYIIIAIVIATRKDMAALWRAVQRGGWYTIGLTGFILAAVAISFNTLFTLFHSLFFEGDSWIFLWTDTLIRLFPPRFWQDAFIGVAGITLLLAVLAIVGGGRLAARSSRRVNFS